MTTSGYIIIDLFYRCLDSIRPTTNRRVISEQGALVIKQRYNFNESKFPTFEEISKEHLLTRERIRQIHNNSLNKISNAGKNLKSVSECAELLKFLSETIESSDGDTIYKKIIHCWKNNLPDYPGEIIVRLFSNLIFSSNDDIEKSITTYNQYRKLEFDNQRQLDLIEKNKEKSEEKILAKQKYILEQVVWFEKRTQWNNVNLLELEPKRQVSDNSKYNSGLYESYKCKRSIQFESGKELDFIKQLENFPEVKFYVEQPVRIEYIRNGKSYVYTPDFAVYLENKEAFFVEIKDFKNMMDARVHRNLEALIEYCEQHGFGLLLTDGKNTINNFISNTYNTEFEKELSIRLGENGGRLIFFNEFNFLKNKYNAKWIEFLSIVFKNNWAFYSFPFKLSNRNNYQVFRKFLTN